MLYRIGVDPIYPPPLNFNPKSLVLKSNCVEEMKYELVYDERIENVENVEINVLEDEKLMKEEEEDFYEDDGEDWDDL